MQEVLFITRLYDKRIKSYLHTTLLINSNGTIRGHLPGAHAL